METKQLIQASAEVVTITSFKAGDVYKRIDTSGYADPTLRFGIVQSVMNNGSDSAFTALEMRADYNAGVTVETKVFDGSKPAALFAAEPAELSTHLEEIRKSVEAKQATARRALEDADRTAALFAEIVGRITSAELTTPDVIRGELASE